MRIAVIGNSHGACLRQAINSDLFKPDDAGLSVEFFLSPQLTIRHLVVEGRSLLARDPELIRKMNLVGCANTTIDTAKFDAFLVMGAQFAVLPIDPWLSEAVKTAAVQDQMRATICWSLVRHKLRKITDKPIFVGHQPLPAEKPEDLRARHPRMESYERALIRYEALFAEADAQTAFQPQETREGMTTASRFSLGSRQLLDDKPHDEKDINHMNEEYGAIYWRSLVKLLSARVAPEA